MLGSYKASAVLCSSGIGEIVLKCERFPVNITRTEHVLCFRRSKNSCMFRGWAATAYPGASNHGGEYVTGSSGSLHTVVEANRRYLLFTNQFDVTRVERLRSLDGRLGVKRGAKVGTGRSQCCGLVGIRERGGCVSGITSSWDFVLGAKQRWHSVNSLQSPAKTYDARWAQR